MDLKKKKNKTLVNSVFIFFLFWQIYYKCYNTLLKGGDPMSYEELESFKEDYEEVKRGSENLEENITKRESLHIYSKHLGEIKAIAMIHIKLKE